MRVLVSRADRAAQPSLSEPLLFPFVRLVASSPCSDQPTLIRAPLICLLVCHIAHGLNIPERAI